MMTAARRSVCRLLNVTACLLIGIVISFLSFASVAAGTVDATFSTPVRLSAGKMHSALILQDGSLYTWGDNAYGQLGLSETEYSDLPQKVIWPERIVDVSLGADHTLFLTESGDVYAMGRNSFGQLGNGSTLHSEKPVQVTGLPAIQSIASGLWHSLALGEDGSVWGWGDNTSSQIGEPRGEAIEDASGNIVGYRQTKPVQIIMEQISAIAAGGAFSLAIDSAGNLLAWGDNARGQLGDGTQQTRTTPTAVTGLNKVRSVSAGYQHVLAVVDDTGIDRLYTWGDNNSGQLGTGGQIAGDSYQPLPRMVSLLDRDGNAFAQIIQIHAGYAHSIAVIGHAGDSLTPERQSLLVWGDNEYGQLGLGHTNAQTQPQLLAGRFNGFSGSDFLPFEAVAAGGSHTLVFSSKGLMAAAGLGSRGQLGTRSIVSRLSLTHVPVPDLIRPGWRTGDQLSVSRENGMLTVRWPQAQDNIGVAGYRLTLQASDGTGTAIDVGLGQEWQFPDTDDSEAYSISVFVFDSASQDLPSEQLSSLAGFLPPLDMPHGKEADFFTDSAKSNHLILLESHHWRPSKSGVLQPLEVPWDVSAVYDADVLPKAPDFRPLIFVLILTAGMLILSILAGIKAKRMKAVANQAVKPPAVDIKRIQ